MTRSVKTGKTVPTDVNSGAKDRSTVQSVERSLVIMEALAASGTQVAIVDVAKRTGLHVSTVHRLMSTLMRRGYVRQNPETSKYSLGLKVLQLASGASRHINDLRSMARPYLYRLMELTGETVNLVILDGDEAVYVEQVESPRLVRMFTKIGRRVSLHSTGVGKVLMCQLPDEQVDVIVARRGLPAFTKMTITDPNELRTELGLVRVQGFALDDEEQEEGVRCVAAPVFDHDWTTVAALSVSAPVTRLSREQAIALSVKIKETAFDLSATLGLKKDVARKQRDAR